jgi:hypothetical protein
MGATSSSLSLLRVFSFTLLHQITVFARHWVRFEPLLADFASTGTNISGEWSEGEASSPVHMREKLVLIDLPRFKPSI